MQRFSLSCNQRAGDIQVYLMLPTDPRETVGTVNRSLKAVLEWVRASKLKLNPNKTGVLI